MISPRPLTARLLGALALGVLVPATGSAAVAVLTNHTSSAIAVEVFTQSGAAEARVLAPGVSVSFSSSEPLTVAYPSSMGRQSEPLVADAIYRFATARQGGHSGVELRRIALIGDQPAPPVAAAWAVGSGGGDSRVRVLLCVDEEEPALQRVWRQRLAARLAEASEVIARHAGVRLEVVGYRTWESDNRLTQFEQSLADFERSVTPDAGVLAIGFTSQYQVQLGRHRMGGTRGPLRRHILLREWSPRVSESERVELLVHELGHYLGAGHSPEATSVMRPVLGDRPVRLKTETLRFDPVNTLAIAMVGEEVRRRGVHDLAQLSRVRRDRLQRIYATLSALTPGEPAGAALLQRLAAIDHVAGEAGGAVTDSDRAEGAATEVVNAVTRAAAANQKRDFAARQAGDDLANALVRAGASASDNPKGFLIGVGVALDDVGGLRLNPRTRAVADRVEPDRQRRARLNVLGEPTARRRHDWLKHFVVSAALTALHGEKEAYAWGVGKELADAARQGGSGFSFADLAADRAGIRFARGVLTGNPPLAGLASGFRVENYVPEMDGLEEGLPLDEVVSRYGGKGDPRFEAVIAEIDRRIDALPAYALMRLGLP